MGVEWQHFQNIVCYPPGPDPQAWEAGFSLSVIEDYVGGVTVFARVSYQAPRNPMNQNPPIQTTVVSLDVIVPPPDGFIKPNPNTVTLPLPVINPQNGLPIQGTFAILEFVVTSDGFVIGNSGNIVDVKENIRNLMMYDIGSNKLKSYPDVSAVGDPRFLGINGPAVMDIKYCTFIAPFNQVCIQYDQDIVLYIPDQYGNVYAHMIGSMFVTYRMDNTGNNIIYTVQ